MPKYLLKVNYTAEGVRGVIQDGGTKRESAARALVESLGGRIEAFYFSFGEADALLICDFPDASRAVAGALAVNASGTVTLSTTPLITTAEVDAAAKLTPRYRGPSAEA